MKYIIANWKANKTLVEAENWIETFIAILNSNEKIKNSLINDKLTVIIAPPYPFIIPLKNKLGNQKNIFMGSQDLSSVEEGSYTGEVTAKTLSSLINYAMVGHSERRANFNETEEWIEKKIDLAKKHGIEPILCVRNNDDHIYDGVKFIAYEPPSSIGNGNNEDVSKVIDMKKRLSLKEGVKFIYGASVDGQNCQDYFKNSEIDGLLVGTASKDPNSFCSILEKV